MIVKPQIRLVILILILLIQFFFLITYINSLAGKNVELTQLQAAISKENRSQGEYKETVAQKLNEQIVTDTRNETIRRISPDETIKLRDIQPAPNTTDTTAPQQQNIVSF